MYVNHNLFAEDSWSCALCFLLDWTWQRIFNFSRNLDNCRVFSMISLQFSFINIFLFQGVYTISLQLLRNLREEEREEERESLLWKIGVSQIHWDILMWLWLGFSGGMFWGGNLRDEILKNLYFRLHYTLQHGMVVLSVFGCFWMQELMWLPKMWDERERWKTEWENELGEERESLWDCQESVHKKRNGWLILEFLLGCEIISNTFKQNDVCDLFV